MPANKIMLGKTYIDISIGDNGNDIDTYIAPLQEMSLLFTMNPFAKLGQITVAPV